MANAIDPRWAWEAYRPSNQQPWDLRKVGHLYRRAAFGATWAELQAGVTAGPEKCIDQLLQGGPGLAEFERSTLELSKSIRRTNDGPQGQAWWLYRMLYTPHPLKEKLTLCWHNHFATSQAKVQNMGYMLGQYDLLYRHALGNFRQLLHEITLDPAMMIWLDTIQSKKGQPNENYARELMELFSLGIGNYTETDIREAAKALTGYELRQGKAFWNATQHDSSVKTVFGKSGAFTAADIVNLCLDHEACPKFIAKRLFRFFVSETIPPTEELLAPLANQLRQSNFDLAKVTETILRSNLFFSPQAYRSRIKSPVDFALGIVRALEGRIGTTGLVEALSELGQRVFEPPSVKGWDGGATWLNGQTLLYRQNLALALTSTEDPRFGRRTDPARLAAKYRKETDADLVDFLVNLFLQGDIAPESRQSLLKYLEQSRHTQTPVYWTAQDAAEHRIRVVCHLVLTLPEFQLD